MAYTSAVSMVMPITYSTQKNKTSADVFFKPLPVRKSSSSRPIAASNSGAKSVVKASLKEKAVTGLTAAALTASMMIPEVAEAASGSGVSPSLNNFLLSIGAGGAVLVAILGAIIAVSNFDLVKRA